MRLLRQEWGEFLHKPGVKFPDFDEIRKEIEADTDRVTGEKCSNVFDMIVFCLLVLSCHRLYCIV